jgi:hypothetical protein
MGPILTVISAYYEGDSRTSDLMTYPTLFMGIGNIIAMPLLQGEFSLVLFCKYRPSGLQIQYRI